MGREDECGWRSRGFNPTSSFLLFFFAKIKKGQDIDDEWCVFPWDAIDIREHTYIAEGGGPMSPIGRSIDGVDGAVPGFFSSIQNSKKNTHTYIQAQKKKIANIVNKIVVVLVVFG